MKRPLTLPAALIALAVAVAVPAVPRSAAASVFCPVAVAAFADVSSKSRPNTYGILLDVDRGDTRTARVRIDTDHTRYAFDVDDIPLMTFAGLRLPRYVSLPAAERVTAVWVQSTGLAANQRLDCQMSAVWNVNSPAPSESDRRLLADAAFRTKRSTATPFGALSQDACAQPNAPARPLAPIKPAFPPDARSVNATGVVELIVDVDDIGAVAGAAITRSSGFASLDRAALETAKRAKYAPATFACHPIATVLPLTIGFGT